MRKAVFPRRAPAAAFALVLAGAAIGACGGESEPDPATSTGAAASPGEAPRSAVLVTVDTLRADVLGAYGGRLGASPNLDRLAEGGVLFEQAHAASSNTLPSHSTLLTGKHPFRHGVRSNIAGQLGAEQITVAERLAEAGFTTAAEVASVVLASHTGIGQGFASFRDTRSPDVALPEPDPSLSAEMKLSLSTRNAEDITSRGIEFLEAHAGQAFFLWLHYYDPHWPYTPPEPFKSRFQRRLASVGLAAEPGADKPPDREHFYAAEVAYVDAELGRLVSALQRLGLAERTLLAVTSDHGEALGEHGENTHGYFVYQSTMWVPLILWGPSGLPEGRRVARPVRPVDLAPTLLAWLGAPALDDADGESLWPLIEAPDVGPERLVYGESVELKRVFGAPVLRFVREGDWKYVHKPRPALYDLSSDATERRNLAAEEPARATRLLARLEALVAEADAAVSSGAPELDAATAAQLEALGYAVGASGPAFEAGEGESLEVAGIDPEDMFYDVHAITRAWPEDGDRRGEVERMSELAARYPDSSPVLEKLLEAQLGWGLAEEALATLRRGVELSPDYDRYWSNLGELLVKLGRDEEAREVLPQAVERFPCEHTSRIHLASYHARDGDHAARIALLEEGLAADCEEPAPELANELAYTLATAPEDALRDGARALELARRAVEGLPDNPLVLDTLAVAQAEAGKLEAAQQTLARALSLAREQELPEAALAALNAHANALQRGQAIRE